MGRVHSTIGEKRDVYRILGGGGKTKNKLGKPRCNWVDNIKMDLRLDLCGMDLFGSV
jgi:hypothetical protein